MSEKNKLERIEGICDSYQVDAQVAERAIAKIKVEEEGKSKKKAKSPIYKWLPAIVCAVAIIAVSVGFLLKPAPTAYFDSASVELVKETDLPSVIAQNAFTAKYFKESSAENKLGVIKESQKIGYFEQKIFFVTFWDNVHFRAKVLSNSKFDFEEHFDGCDRESTINNLLVNYGIVVKKDAQNFDQSEISAKFKHGGNEYFIIIESFGEVEPTEKISQYLDMLFSE